MWSTLKQKIEGYSPKAAKYRGVKEYALDIVWRVETRVPWDEFCNDETCWAVQERILLDGAGDWREYSVRGKSLTQPDEIARRLYGPRQIKKIVVDDTDRCLAGLLWEQGLALERAASLIDRYAHEVYLESRKVQRV